MRINKLLFLITIIPSLLYGAMESKISPSANFGGGLNIKTAASDIEDTESPDMSNMVNDIYGASMKRGGSKRYFAQSISSFPVTALYKAVMTTGTVTKEALIMANRDRLYYSTSDISPQWICISSYMGMNQHYEFITADNNIIVTGDQLVDPIKKIDIVNQSTALVYLNQGNGALLNFKAKHAAYFKNYLLFGNIVDLSGGTTYYPSRAVYSSLVDISSFPKNHIMDFSANDGDEITAMWIQNGYWLTAKRSKIYEVNAEILDPDPTVGDQTKRPLVNGYGVLNGRTLATDGHISIFLSQDGIRLFNNGVDNRAESGLQSKIISTKIDPIIQNIIKNGTYDKCSAIFYKKKSWYLFSYFDENKFPNDKPNAILVYDLISDSWFPFDGWQVESFSTFDGPKNNGELIYGDSQGYVYYADTINKNDARKEFLIDGMESTDTWKRSVQEINHVKEGTASLKIICSNSVSISSISKMGVFNLGEFDDKKPVTNNDLLSFKVHVTSAQNISSMRIDLEISNTAGNDFDTNYTSVTLSSGSFIVGQSTWSTIEISLSSFTILDTWVSSLTQTFPFSDTLIFYGIRFVVNHIDYSTVTIDDLRIVQKNESSIYAYRYSKQYDFGCSENKTFSELILSVEQPPNSKLSIDLFKDFGEFNKTEEENNNYQNILYVSRLNENESISKLDSLDFSIIESTLSKNRESWAIRPFVVDKDYIYGGDQFNERIIKFDRNNLTDDVFISSYGELGSGTTNFNEIYQIAQDNEDYKNGGKIYVCDFLNHRVKAHRKKDLSYVMSYSSGLSCPNGVAVDDNYVYVANEGNSKITIYKKNDASVYDNFSFNVTCIAGASLAVDEKYIYIAYKVVNSDAKENYDLILEKRLKSPKYNLLISRKILPVGVSETELSSSTTIGDISVAGDFLYIPFTTNMNTYTDNYIHKILSDDLSFVKEYKTNKLFCSVYSPSQSYSPRRKRVNKSIGLNGRYIQNKFYIDGLDNTTKLYNQSYKVIPSEACK